ncbi:phosphoglucosamine mutase [Verrucomicrobium sp. GAS474]|uniref:phosphoglucosamine mutase n=1 Tax=Verrucomicrobium sp. GAS474 TaxID=1882831 RepID=UPI0008792134|nr:phosphoglucosamine mutase [Verrucomicrobium sp. GAS474]SDU01329.1 phosphoglucosamine mutase [Verrucomicrobium sp. GAS474]
MTQQKLFGTDGIRGVANVDPITPEVAFRLGGLMATVFGRNLAPGARPRVLIGRDTRLSGPMLEAALLSGLLSHGADATLLGVLPTPGVALLVRQFGAAAAVVISASHNPFADNGLKIFQGTGYKCDDALEAEIEAGLLDGRPLPRPEGNGLGRLLPLRAGETATSLYERAIVASWPHDPAALPLKGLKIALDAANGASYQTSPAVLRALGAEVIVAHDAPDGVNINEGCGSTHPEVVEALVKQSRARVGISHDGDADRVICCDETGSALDGDELLAIVGLDLLRSGRLPGKAMVATVMSNLALDELFASEGGRIARCAVGDRAVLETMLAEGLAFGGEQSGHVILKEHATTGDGLLSALALLRVVVESRKPLSELRRVLKKYPQTLVNLKVRVRTPFAEIPGLESAIAEAEKTLGTAGRLLLRYSGTEPKIRLLIEAKDEALLAPLAEKILAPVKAAIGV